MGDRIELLPPEVVTKIAAGEVIERPASVVKELLENAVDAGARRIDVAVEAGGTESIQVVDNGSGIFPEDLPLAFANHATSKLRTVTDLFAIRTLGFRGEALASIGSVAQVLLQSRSVHAEVGAEIHCHGGQLSELRPWNGAVGTRVEVRHLFYNIPVRKKFLKSVATELGHICEVVTRMALACPHIHLTLRHNGKLVYDIPVTTDLRERIGLFFGAEVQDALYEVDSGAGPIRLWGYIADPRIDRAHARMQYLFLNGRWFRDRIVSHALQEAYRGLLLSGRYPVAFLFLTLPPHLVDVNVHPTKAEVRFQDSSQIYSLIRSTLQRRLHQAQLIPDWRWSDTTPPTQEVTGHSSVVSSEKPPVVSVPGSSVPGSSAPAVSPRYERAMQTVAPWESSTDLKSQPGSTVPVAGVPAEADVPATESPVSFPSSLFPVDRPECLSDVTPPTAEPDRGTAPIAPPLPETVCPSPIPPVSSSTPATQADSSEAPGGPEVEEEHTGPALQIQDTYIVQETPQGMLVIDQHALHERILFEQLRQRILHGSLEVQPLLVPEPMELTATEAAALLSVVEILRTLGLEITPFGGNTVLIQAYPALLARRSPREVVRGVLDYLLAHEQLPSRETLLYGLLATMACKAAIKAGDRLSPEEIAALLRLRRWAEKSHHCPHGRPTTLLISRSDLDRQFRRT
jgi:DNA mismatch repair protein MutL